MAALDLSSLAPLNAPPPPSAGGASGELDLSSLKPFASTVDNGPVTDDAAADEPNASMSSLAKNFGTGLIAGIPNLETAIEGALTPPGFAGKPFGGLAKPEDVPESAGDIIKKGLGLVGANPDDPSQMPQPSNAPERVARMMGEGASGMLIPMGDEGIAANLAGKLFTGASAGAGAGIGQEVAPDRLKPLASLVGSLIGGGIGAGVTEIPRAVKATASKAADIVAPSTEAGAQRIAGKVLAANASDPDAAVQAIESAPRQLVPGSKPTTFQLTGDMGLGNLERGINTRNADSRETFLNNRADQNAARLDALDDLESQGHPEAVSQFFRNQLDELDRRTQDIQDRAAQAAKGSMEGLGGGAPEVTGEALRTAMQNGLNAAKAHENSLWNAVDPDKNLMTIATPIKRAYQSVYGSLSPERSIGLMPEEKAIGDIVNGYGRTLPFQRLTDLRGEVSRSMREARGGAKPNDLAYGRLSQLRGAIEDAISDSVAQKVAQEQQAVSMGALQPAETTLQRWTREAQSIIDARRQGSRTADSGAGESIVGRPQLPSGEMGAGSAESGNVPGTSSAEEGSRPFLDDAAAQRLKAASAATAERAQTYKTGPARDILKREGNTQPYKLPASGVTSKAWKAGNGGGDTVRAVLKASNNAPEAVDALQGMAAQSLRDHAKGEPVTSASLNAWRAKHGPALQALEEAAPGTTLRYENAARASDTLENIATQRRQALDDYRKSAIGKIMNLDDPADVTRTVGDIFGKKNAVQEMRSLVTQASKDPDAIQGLRRAIVEVMKSKLISNTEAATSGRNLIKADQFQTFLGKNHQVLRQAFSDEELNSMRAIAQDLKRANRSVVAARLPGGSNTAQDYIGAHASGMKQSLLGKIFLHLLGAGVGAGVDGGLVGLVGGAVGGHLVSALRESGMKRVDDLVREAMSDPDLARTLLLKAPKKADTGSEVTLANKLRRMAIFSTVLASEPR